MNAGNLADWHLSTSASEVTAMAAHCLTLSAAETVNFGKNYQLQHPRNHPRPVACTFDVFLPNLLMRVCSTQVRMQTHLICLHSRLYAPRKNESTMKVFCLLLLATVALAARSKNERNERAFCECNKKYKPVCGEDDQTYGNECIAQCMNVVVKHKGKCKKCPKGFGDCQCNDVAYKPVCAGGLTWKNRCEAECGGRMCAIDGICRNAQGQTWEATVGGADTDIRASSKNTKFPNPKKPRHRYDEALHTTLIFYEAQMSGDLPRHRLAWRGDSCLDCKGPAGEDLSGGFLEAGGSYLKMSMPSAFMVTQLAWSVITFKKGFSKAGNLKNARFYIKWGADFIINSHSEPFKMVAMMGNETHDFNYYGPPEEKEMWIEDGWGKACYASKDEPATEAVAESAAALAATAIVFRSIDPEYSELALSHARDLYRMTKKYKGSYGDTKDPCMKIMANLYQSNGYIDELAWAAGWMYKATNKPRYLVDAREYYKEWKKKSYPGYIFTTNDKGPGLHPLMYWIDEKRRKVYMQGNYAFFYQYLEQTIFHTPKGLAYPFHWGTLRHATNVAFLCAIQAKNMMTIAKTDFKTDLPYAARLWNYMEHQVNYVLGDSGRSWISGYGKDYPKHVWHKPSHNSFINWKLRGQYFWMGRDVGPWTVGLHYSKKFPVEIMASKAEMEGNYEPNVFIPYGALFGAPLGDDGLVIRRRDYTYAEPTTEGQGGISGALAAMVEYYDKMEKQDDCGLKFGWDHPNAQITKKTMKQCKA